MVNKITRPNLAILIFVVAILPFQINGFINPVILENKLLFWIFDIFTWVVLPIFLYLFVVSKNILAKEDFAFTFHLTDELDKKKNLILFVILVFLVSFLQFYTYKYSTLLSKELFPVNIGSIKFDYSFVTPDGGFLAVLVSVYMAITAGVVEEIIYRFFLWKLVESFKYRVIIFVSISSLVFASVHWESGVQNLFATFIFGIVSAVIYVIIKNIWPLVIGHFVVDFFDFLK